MRHPFLVAYLTKVSTRFSCKHQATYWYPHFECIGVWTLHKNFSRSTFPLLGAFGNFFRSFPKLENRRWSYFLRQRIYFWFLTRIPPSEKEDLRCKEQTVQRSEPVGEREWVSESEREREGGDECRECGHCERCYDLMIIVVRWHMENKNVPAICSAEHINNKRD